MLIWEEVNLTLGTRVNASQVTQRVPYLEKLQMLVQSETLEAGQLNFISSILLKTYATYNDTASKKVVMLIFKDILRLEPRLFKIYLQFIIDQVSPHVGVKAVAGYLNLLEWINSFLEFASQDETTLESHVSNFLEAHCFITGGVEAVLDNQESTKKLHKKRNQHNSRIRHSLIQSTRRSLVFTLDRENDTSKTMDTMLNILLDESIKAKFPPAGVVTYIGALVQAALQLLQKKPALYNLLQEKYVEKYCAFIGKEVIIGKAPVSTACLESSLSPFIKEFINEELFKTSFLPNLEKGILRAPENGFNIAAEFYSAVDFGKIDILNIFVSSKLMTQTFSNLKSSKEPVKMAALNSIVALLSNAPPQKLAEPDLEKLVDEVFKNIKANLNAEYKSLASKILIKVPVNSQTVSSKLVTGLSNYILKESNEAALSLLLDAFFTHYFSLPDLIEEINKTIKAGLNEKKVNLKKLWMISFLKHCSQASAELLDVFSESLMEFFSETMNNQNKHDHNSILACSEYIDRVETLAMGELTSKIHGVIENLPAEFYYGDSHVNATLSTILPYNDRIHAAKLLRRAFERNPKLVGLGVVRSLEKKIQVNKSTLTEQNVAFKFSAPIFNAISCPVSDKLAQQEVLVQLLIISQYPFQLKNGWAGLVLNAGMNPSMIIAENSSQIMERILAVTNDNSMNGTPLYECVLKAAAYSSFVNPKAMAPLLVKTIESDLATKDITKYTTTDLEIWKGEEGTMVIDVVDKQTASKLADKNSKDYETLKWEESIKKKQAMKTAKKYTKEQQVLVNEQLKKESTIRSEISAAVSKIKRGIQLINYLSKDALMVDNGIQTWFPTAITKLLELAQIELSSKLVDGAVNDAFLNVSSNVSDRLDSTRLFIGLAILRVHKVANISENYMQESLTELVSRVLFRIKFVANQNALDSISLTYLLPLLINVLHEGMAVALKNASKPVHRTEFVEEDKEEEHLLLAMEIISIHAQAFQDSSIPRVPIIGVLLSLLGLASKAKFAKDCFNALCQSISISPTKDDLAIILSHLLSPNPFVRATVLETLDNEFELEPYMKWSPEVFICRFESDAGNRELADFIWEFSHFTVTEELLKSLLNFFDKDDSGLRLFVARAYAAATFALEKEDSALLKSSIGMLMDFYKGKAKPLEDVIDEFGLVTISASDRKDTWQDRSTAAIALKELSVGLKDDTEDVVDIIKFLIQDGPLGDTSALVRQEMKEAGIEVIALHGAEKSEELIPIFEQSLTSKTSTTIKENVIILYGTLARHLQKDDPRIHTIVDRLLATLDTPSSEVQQAVSACISPLVSQFRDNVESHINDLMSKLLDPNLPTSVKKGAAWGIAGLVKGYGILALSEFDIIRNLIEAAEDKKEPKRRQSVAYLFEYLSLSLEEYFEPYIIEILPNILKNLGDSVPEVRDATAQATKVIMAHTTSYGVTKLIPVAISNLDEIAWRTKRGSVELLGNMAYLDPTQLSASLSTIVPQIVGVLNDSHKEVRKAADESLKRFGEVIRNPEIQQMVPVLIKAIGDPTKYTEDALDALIQTQFVHYIDGPSLALIIHVIHRGMHERSANTKRKACKIVGNMAILVDTKDLLPYLQQLIDEVEIAMVDPVPNTRATAARALGALVERLGEEQFPDLIPRLLDTLSDETKAGDRLGSAQALAEVISGLGLSKLEELLPTILSGVSSYRSYVREGYAPLLLFIPICFGAQFAPYINQIIQPILAGLADVDENIRDTALKAGKLLVKNYASKAIDLLLPELERGMFDENERIRLSSVQLTGELLFQVTGISSRNEFSDEDGEYHGEVSNKIVDILGQDRRDRVLAALFVCRNDSSGIVRASTVDIWKALVPNTPRVIREVLPTLTVMIVTNLASSSSSLRNIAAQTLGDMVRRVGGNALSQLLPTLDESVADATNPDSRQGVCIALYELIESSNTDALEEFFPIIVNIIRQTLIDSSKSVRQAAAASFDAFQTVAGKVAIDEVIPYLLNMLGTSEKSENALLGLQDIMSTKSEVIFPVLIPTLLAPPIDSFRASALGSLAEVAGSALYKRLSVVVNSLVDAIVSSTSEEERESLNNAMDKVFLSVTEEEGLHPLMQQIMALLKNENMEKRIAVLDRLPNFFEKTVLNLDVYVPDFVSNAILFMDDKDPRVVKGNCDALTVLLKKQDKAMLERLVKPAKQSLAMVGTPRSDLAAFTLPRGPNCVLPIFLHGLMYGSNDEREASALAIADVVSKTPSANLKPFVSVITGPLIRVVGERFSSDIKAAILFALNILFMKIPQFLRPFIPQLQRTFVKSLSDSTNETLRLRAAKALGTLIEYQPRVDPLVIELVSGTKQTSDEGVKTAMLKALLEVVTKAGSKLNETSKSNIVNLVEEEMLVSNDKMAIAYAKLIGSLSEILSSEEAAHILKDKVLDVSLEGNSGKFAILTVNSFLSDAPGHIFQESMVSHFVDYIISSINSSDVYFSDNGVIAAGKMLLLINETKSPKSKVECNSVLILSEENIAKLTNILSLAMIRPVSNSSDTRRLCLVVTRTVARFKFDVCVKPYLDILGPSVFACLRDPVIPIKLAAEKAYLAIFKLIEEPDMETFQGWFEQLSAGGTASVDTVANTTIQLRSIGDYTKRVGKRLANVERERIADGGDAETLYSDRFEDETEIWAVGGVELNPDAV
ncbi:Gcn1p KNAG_0G01370 [Huiozyma naganishii CBS 8797]|uniref:eIF-2-alpha kinase activator GCN1 n=1 Tax=Huiozyma naganishii (strain ATCC MYA-139 / BCRC 22969 / CBS 8797 / KCTC 17520 / NBRC 10181 / NCYC 3082 / Yp74L-3) TaxID=1071383 RepID=J7R8J8_HUIN7|nr:hypothetical protein KNAG_0G01370 [Kazachstania naganishii CBS 8797]CCK71195.1 hypothetical protein KNAG_0G01370 [Kazachstania naganishii CBS 8797]